MKIRFEYPLIAVLCLALGGGIYIAKRFSRRSSSYTAAVQSIDAMKLVTAAQRGAAYSCGFVAGQASVMKTLGIPTNDDPIPGCEKDQKAAADIGFHTVAENP